jgi:MFS family permease
LTLLAIAILISYIDRGNLSVAAPLLKDELQLSASQLGMLFTAFFWAYTVFIFVSGWIVDRIDVNWVIAAGFAIWSIATAATGLVHGFVMLFVMRLLLGVGESVSFPSCSKILARHLTEESRGFANGLISMALRAGPAVGTFGAGMLMARYGWRIVFIGIGIASLGWLPAWMKWMPRHPGLLAASLGSLGPRFEDILRQRSFWGATIGHFGGNYFLYFLVTWLPFYLVHERNLSMQAMAKTAGAYYLVDAAVALTTGYLADVFIRRGRSVTFVRKLAMAVGHVLVAAGFLGCAAAGQGSYLVWLLILALGSGISGAGIFAFSQTLAGPIATGRWVGLQNGFANLAGVISPAVAGFLVDRTGHFTAPLVVVAAMSLIAALAWTLIVGPLSEIDWASSGAAGAVAPPRVTDT